MAGRGKWYALILLGIVAVPAVTVPFLLDLSRPEFTSVDDVDPGDVSRIDVRLFNLRSVVPPTADGEAAPDTVGPFDAEREDYPVLLGLLKGARKVTEMPPGPWLGQYEIRLTNGRTQRVRIKFSGNPAKPEALTVWFRIANSLEFQAAGTVKEFVSAVAAAERKAKPR